MTVEVHWTVAPRLLTEELVAATVEAALAHGGRAGAAIEVVLVDDATLADLHGRFLGDPTPTDVMAFDLGEEEGGAAGEIYVSVDRAEAVAAQRGSDARRELALYLVHGALHLCGWDDHEEGERQEMRAAERRVLEHLGYAHDELPHELEDDS